ncbi:MAG: transposase [Bdellovibrionales bacterium]|nr:transposase [Bdellovibrionales bacterium]
MKELIKVKRKCFTKAQKISILNELNISGITLSELARKYQISSVALYRWRRKMNKEITPLFPDYQHVVSELEKTKKENEQLKKALGELAVEKQILQTSNEILKKRQMQKMFSSRKKSLRK